MVYFDVGVRKNNFSFVQKKRNALVEFSCWKTRAGRNRFTRQVKRYAFTTMKKQLTRLTSEELLELYRNQKTAIKNRLSDFKHVSSKEYFYELAYCLMAPQSSAVNADKAIQQLKAFDFKNTEFNPEQLLYQKEYYIRFHKTKAKHLLTAKEHFQIIHHQRTNGGTSTELREWLVKNVKGLGWKESSHFLRNIGHRNLAILDRHILKNLLRLGVLKQLPKTLTSKHYLAIEKKFVKFSGKIGIPMDELDLLFWSMETGEILR